MNIIFLNERHEKKENIFISISNLDKEYFSEISLIPGGFLFTFISINYSLCFVQVMNLHAKPFNPGSQMQILFPESCLPVCSSTYMTVFASVCVSMSKSVWNQWPQEQ